MMNVLLTRGLTALVDDADASRVLARRWHVRHDKLGRWIAVSGDYVKTRRVHCYRLHAFILGVRANTHVHFLNDNPLDCRRKNMSVQTLSARQQGRNMPTGASGYRGVSKNKRVNLWRAYITVNDRQKWLGHYEEAAEAARVYDAAARKFFGPLALVNFP